MNEFKEPTSSSEQLEATKDPTLLKRINQLHSFLNDLKDSTEADLIKIEDVQQRAWGKVFLSKINVVSALIALFPLEIDQKKELLSDLSLVTERIRGDFSPDGKEKEEIVSEVQRIGLKAIELLG
jgi:hypothetical protein